MCTPKYIIREMRTDEKELLNDLLYEAIFQTEGSDLLPREIIFKPEIYVYIENFGWQDDHCFVAEVNGKVVGAVWVRILAGSVKGFGHIDHETPEFAISLFKEYRNMGIGTALMNKMISHLAKEAYKQTSLSVDKNNYAVKLYKKLGFKIIKEQAHDYIMLLELNTTKDDGIIQQKCGFK